MENTIAQNKNVETVLEIINDLYDYTKIHALLSPDKIKERYLGRIMTRLEELLDNNLEGFDTFREAIMLYHTNLEAFRLNAQADADEFYDIIKNIALDCEILQTCI
jgi:hypothetical protein